MDTQEFSRYGHVVRPGPFRRTQAFWVNGHVLHWRKGREKGHLPLSDIAALTIQHNPSGRVCLVTARDGRTCRIAERHWFRWKIGERFGSSELHAATFTSLVSIIRRRMPTNGTTEPGAFSLPMESEAKL